MTPRTQRITIEIEATSQRDYFYYHIKRTGAEANSGHLGAARIMDQIINASWEAFRAASGEETKCKP